MFFRISGENLILPCSERRISAIFKLVHYKSYKELRKKLFKAVSKHSKHFLETFILVRFYPYNFAHVSFFSRHTNSKQYYLFSIPFQFLDASSHLYMRSCPSVRRMVCWMLRNLFFFKCWKWAVFFMKIIGTAQHWHWWMCLVCWVYLNVLNSGWHVISVKDSYI